jgi:hypothetical protein
MDYIVFYQSERDSIKFVTSKNPERDFMKYYKFLEYLNKEFQILNFFELKDALDRFKTIILYSDNTWEIIPDEVSNVSFEQLYAINNEDQEKEKSVFDRQVDRQKGLLNQIFDFRKKDSLNKYKNK